jgi:hypothetical protein
MKVVSRAAVGRQAVKPRAGRAEPPIGSTATRFSIRTKAADEADERKKRLNHHNGARRHFRLCPLVSARRREVKRCGRISFIRTRPSERRSTGFGTA